MMNAVQFQQMVGVNFESLIEYFSPYSRAYHTTAPVESFNSYLMKYRHLAPPCIVDGIIQFAERAYNRALENISSALQLSDNMIERYIVDANALRYWKSIHKLKQTHQYTKEGNLPIFRMETTTSSYTSHEVIDFSVSASNKVGTCSCALNVTKGFYCAHMLRLFDAFSISAYDRSLNCHHSCRLEDFQNQYSLPLVETKTSFAEPSLTCNKSVQQYLPIAKQTRNEQNQKNNEKKAYKRKKRLPSDVDTAKRHRRCGVCAHVGHFAPTWPRTLSSVSLANAL